MKPMKLYDFFNLIDEPTIYIVRLEYKYVYEDKIQVSNEILQFDPGYSPFISDPRYPWYHELWVWYDDWYMCVDPESVRVINYVELEGVFNEET